MKKTKSKFMAYVLCVALFAANVVPSEIVAAAKEAEPSGLVAETAGADMPAEAGEEDGESKAPGGEFEGEDADDPEKADDESGEEDAVDPEKPDEESGEGDTESEKPDEEYEDGDTESELSEEGFDEEVGEAEQEEDEDMVGEEEMLPALSTLAETGTILKSGEWSGITWTIDSDYKLTLEGSGGGSFSDISRLPWNGYTYLIQTAEIKISGVNNLSYMFSGFSSMVSVDFSGSDLSSVTNMYRMFQSCASLEKIEFGSSNIDSVMNMSEMFFQCRSLKSVDMSCFDTGNVTDMSKMFIYCDSLESMDISGFNTESVTNMSEMFSGCSALASLDMSRFNVQKVTDMSGMFYGCSKLESIDLSGFQTSSVTNMSNMFYRCSKLKELDLSGLDTSNVTNISGIFQYCSGLTSLNMSGMDISKVTDLSNLFSSCSSLTSLDMSNMKAGGITKMSSMFNGCSRLQSIDLSGFNTSSVTDMSSMFSGCFQLTDINLSGCSTDQVKNMSNMFSGCSKLTNLSLTGFSTVNATNMSSMFSGCTGLTDLDLSSFDTANVTDMSSMFSGCYKLQSINLSSFNTENVTNMSFMFHGCYALTELDLSGFRTGKVENMASMFGLCSGLETLDVSAFDTGMVRSMASMFYRCEKVKNLDVSGFDGSSVTTTESMFEECYNLLSLDLSSFGGEKIETTENMFYDCNSLTSLKLDGFSAAKATTMRSMFYQCYELKSLDLSSFQTGNVTDMCLMFGQCVSLENLNVEGFDTSNVQTMRGMFNYCESLKALDVSHFNTANVKDMQGMFGTCSSLQSLDLSGFQTAKVTDMQMMFASCRSLTSLDLSSFDTSNVNNMQMMFLGCDELKNLNLNSFDTRSVTDMTWMFMRCQNMKTLDLSSFNMANVTKAGGMFFSCLSMDKIYTPYNVTLSVELPSSTLLNDKNEVWYQPDGKKITNLPQNLGYSTVITKNKKPSVSAAHLEVTKEKTDYKCGETLNLDDIQVKYYNGSGSVSTVTDYTTNAGEIDMSRPGKKELVISYNTGTAVLSASVELTVTYVLEEGNVTVTIADEDCIYNGKPQTPPATVRVTIEGIEYTLQSGTDYQMTYENNVDASETAPRAMVTGINDYEGTIVKNFTIHKAASPEDETMTVYVPAGREQSGHKLFLSDSFADYGKKTGYVITNVEEDDQISGSVFSKVPVTEDINAKGILTCGIAAGAENDFAAVTVKISFVNYQDAGLTVRVVLKDKTEVELAGIEMPERFVYTGGRANYYGRAAVMTNGTVLSEDVEIACSYQGWQDDGIYYDDYEAPTDAGTYTLTAAVSDYDDRYTGSREYPFTIVPASVTIKARDTVCVQGTKPPAQTDYPYDTEGLLNGDELISEPTFTYLDAENYVIQADKIDTNRAGALYRVLPDRDSAFAGYNYNIICVEGRLVIAEEEVACTVTFDMMGHGPQVDASVGLKAGSLLAVPSALEEGSSVTESGSTYIFAGWYKDTTFAEKQKWNFDTDTIQGDVTLYACWLSSAEEGGSGTRLCVQEIRNQTYTGSAIKPAVLVYSGDGRTLLKSGKDYSIKYCNNIEADTQEERNKGGIGSHAEDSSRGFTKDLAYVIITGKGNYQGTIYLNFHIDAMSIGDGGDSAASGITLKYTEQLIVNAAKSQKPFSSIKYKKSMKIGKDYTVELTALAACGPDGRALQKGSVINGGNTDNASVLPVIPAGYSGTFTMSVTGKGNYTGSFNKTIIVADKSHLMKNATISLGKNQKSLTYADGKAVILTPGYMVMNGKIKEYYAIRNGRSEKTENANSLFVVSIKDGKTTKYLHADDNDFFVSYTNNKAVGTAAMTITGNPERGYYGSKSVTFKITGTAFNAQNVEIKVYDADTNPNGWRSSVPYTGKAVTQNKIILTPKTADNAQLQTLTYGTHYTISYKNNIKKGTATMTFTAKPESGYTGSFKKTFRITAADIANPDVIKVAAANDAGHEQDNIEEKKDENGNVSGYRLSGAVAYVKGGTKPSDRIVLTNSEGITLKEGTDYTVKYKNNTAIPAPDAADVKKPCMVVTGKGNYAGSLTVYFDIVQAELSEAQIIVSRTALNTKNNYEYKPGVKVTDSVSGKALSAGANKDYVITYENNGQENVTKYVNGEQGALQPKAVITVPTSGSYKLTEGKDKIEIPLPVYRTKLTGSNLYVIVSEEPAQITYTGYADRKVTPEITVYYGEAAAVRAARKDKVTDEAALTNPNGQYKLTKLKEAAKMSDTESDTSPDLETDAPQDAAGDYTVIYGANNAAGKNKGSVTITGASEEYGGSVTVKFTILQRNVYNIL